MKRACLAFSAVLIVAATAAPALAQNELYMFDLGAKYPKAKHAYQALLPKAFKKAAWVYKLDGTAGPIDHKTIGGADFLAGTVCKPHDCGDNIVAVLVTADGKRAVAEVKSADLTQGQAQMFGTPSADETAALEAMLK